MTRLHMISKDKKLLSFDNVRFNNLALFILCFMLASCADRIYIPYVASGSGVALVIEKNQLPIFPITSTRTVVIKTVYP